MPRVALAACFHETNTFATRRTGLAEFRRQGWLEGEELAAAFRDTRTVMGGFVDGAENGFELAPVFGAYATPAGTVTRQAFTTVVDRVIDGLAGARPVDAVLLELHGAMVADGDDDPETTLVRAVRAAAGDVPVVVVTDMHANMTADLVAAADVVVGYRTNPHVDTYECGLDAARHLGTILRTGRRPGAAHQAVPVLAAPIAQATADLPLMRLLHRARELERRHRLLDVSVHVGYAYADVPHAGLSFTATGASESARREVLDELEELARAHRDEFTRRLPDTATAMQRAVDAAKAGGRPVAVADTGDNIGGGAPGDATWLLRAAAQWPDHRVAATICDPEAVTLAADAGEGSRLRSRLGGKGEPSGGAPIEVDATVRWVGDGTFVNTGPMARHATTTMGQAAVLATEFADIVVQSSPVQPNDPELFRCVGFDPVAYDVVLLKGAAAMRAGWAPLVGAFVDAGTPGVTDCDLTRMPYQRLRRPMWPLDHELPGQ